MKAVLVRTAILAVALTGLAACKPEPPPTDEPPEPKAVAATARATELRDSIKEPIDRAKTVEDTQLQAADEQKAAVDAATN